MLIKILTCPNCGHLFTPKQAVCANPHSIELKKYCCPSCAQELIFERIELCVGAIVLALASYVVILDYFNIWFYGFLLAPFFSYGLIFLGKSILVVKLKSQK